MQVMVWFYKHVDTLSRLMRNVAAEQRRKEGLDVNEDDEEEEVTIQPFEILCSNKCNTTENRIYSINNPTECQNELFSSSRNPLKPVKILFVFTKIGPRKMVNSENVPRFGLFGSTLLSYCMILKNNDPE